jgi:4-alpha-glucanotransferase
MLFYGNNDAEIGGVGRTKDGVPAFYQITVYERDPAPEWYADSIVYQIFPDRFNRGQDWEKRSADARRPEEWIGPTRILQENWNDTPFLYKNEFGQVTRWAFFGGTLEGVREKLLYLKASASAFFT